MIKNNVLLKLISNDNASIQNTKASLLSMKDKIDVLLDIQVEINIRPGKSSYDLMFITMFASIDDLNAYLSHPVHLKIGHEISENIANQASVCVESND